MVRSYLTKGFMSRFLEASFTGEKCSKLSRDIAKGMRKHENDIILCLSYSPHFHSLVFHLNLYPVLLVLLIILQNPLLSQLLRLLFLLIFHLVLHLLHPLSFSLLHLYLLPIRFPSHPSSISCSIAFCSSISLSFPSSSSFFFFHILMYEIE